MIALFPPPKLPVGLKEGTVASRIFAGKDRGICRAIPMLLFWKLNLQWTQWGLKILETRTTRNSRNVRYLNRQAIVPGW